MWRTRDPEADEGRQWDDPKRLLSDDDKRVWWYVISLSNTNISVAHNERKAPSGRTDDRLATLRSDPERTPISTFPPTRCGITYATLTTSAPAHGLQ